MEGAYYAVVREFLQRELRGRRVGTVWLGPGDSVCLEFGRRVLVLSASPGDPGVELLEGRPAGGPAPVWGDHLPGAVLTGIGQAGLDRVLRFDFRPASPYLKSGIAVVFEPAGRNANVILMRAIDMRILACLRTVTSRQSRLRRIAPGEIYSGPPPSGFPPSEWAGEECGAALAAATTPQELVRLLEGVGPATASAMAEEAGLSGRTLRDVALSLSGAVERQEFQPWMSAFGPMPVRLGRGADVAAVLSPGKPEEEAARRSVTLEARLEHQIELLERKFRRVAEARAQAVPGETYRRWGDLLLAHSAGIPRGATSVDLPDWDGGTVTIPLKPSRGPVENAGRYFRKARNSSLELDGMARLEAGLGERLAALRVMQDTVRAGGTIDEGAISPEMRRRPGAGEVTGPLVRELFEGWRCWIGRNAKENDWVTFRHARRGDIWLHARGASGAHVILRGDGRQENPPGAVLDQAAALAAKHSRNTSAIVPVDYTRVQHVRKPRGSRPGEVVYTGEKTIFVRLGPRRNPGGFFRDPGAV